MSARPANRIAATFFAAAALATLALLLTGCEPQRASLDLCRQRCEAIGLVHDATSIDLIGAGVRCICRKPAADGGGSR